MLQPWCSLTFPKIFIYTDREKITFEFRMHRSGADHRAVAECSRQMENIENDKSALAIMALLSWKAFKLIFSQYIMPIFQIEALTCYTIELSDSSPSHLTSQQTFVLRNSLVTVHKIPSLRHSSTQPCGRHLNKTDVILLSYTFRCS